MDILVARTGQSVYIIGSYGPTTQAVLSRTVIGYDGLGDEPSSDSGEVTNAPVEPGKSIHWLRSTDGHNIHSTLVVSVVSVPERQEATWGDAYRAFNDLANDVRHLGRAIGFEGISKTKGMDSVEAILEDLGRAIRLAR